MARGRLVSDQKTIAELRRQNSAALVAVSASFVEFARQERLIQGDLVAIDGSKIRAVVSKKALGRGSCIKPETPDQLEGHRLDLGCESSDLESPATSDQVTPPELLCRGEHRLALCSSRANKFGGNSILFNGLERVPALRLTPGMGIAMMEAWTERSTRRRQGKPDPY